jgi:hypothetical protein
MQELVSTTQCCMNLVALIPCKSHTISSSAILPITNTMANPGIPLTGSTAMGFTIGIIKG